MEEKLRKVIGEFLQSEQSSKKGKRKYTISGETKARAIHQRAVKSAFREGFKSADQFVKAMKFLQTHNKDPYVQEVQGGPLGQSYRTSLMALNEAFEGTKQEKSVPVDVIVSAPVSEARKVNIPTVPNFVEEVSDMTSKRKADDYTEGPSGEFHNHPAKNVLDYTPLPVGVPVQQAIASTDVQPAQMAPARSSHSTSVLAEHYRKMIGMK